MTAPDLPKVTPSARASVRRPRTVPGGRVRVGRFGPRLLLRGALVGLALLVLVLLLAGCGGGLPPASAPAAAPGPEVTGTAPPTTTTPPAEPTTGADTGPGTAPTTDPGTAPRTPSGPPVTPAPGAGDAAPDGGEPAAEPAVLWPAGDAPTARRMQEQADRGGDPWLLDPQEVTLSYVGAELGYRDPGLVRVGEGEFAVTDGRSPAKATVGLSQTVREGDGGIWLVTRVTQY